MTTRRQIETKLQNALFIAIHICASPILLSRLAWGCFRSSSLYEMPQRRRDSKPPKVRARKRALSFSRSNNLPGDSSKTTPHVKAMQAGSFFFRLPPELRMAVYEEVVGKHEVHIVLLMGQLHSFRCTHHCIPVTRDGAPHCWISRYLGGDRSLNNIKWLYHNAGIGILPLLQSCRRMYVRSPTLFCSNYPRKPFLRCAHFHPRYRLTLTQIHGID